MPSSPTGAPGAIFLHGITPEPPGRSGRYLRERFPGLAMPLFNSTFWALPITEQTERVLELLSTGRQMAAAYSHGAYLCLSALAMARQREIAFPRHLVLVGAHFGLVGAESCMGTGFAQGADSLRRAFGLHGGDPMELPQDLTIEFLHGIHDNEETLHDVRRVAALYPGSVTLAEIDCGHSLSPQALHALGDMIGNHLAPQTSPAEATNG